MGRQMSTADVHFEVILRLDSVTRDRLGCTAKFHGKPDTLANFFVAPISDATAALLIVGAQYRFICEVKK